MAGENVAELYDMPRYVLHDKRSRYGMYTWEGQALQYDQLGPPGEIIYRRFVEQMATPITIETLLCYDNTGRLTGIANYYPEPVFEHTGRQIEKPGNLNLFIRPDEGSKTVVAALTAETQRRWNVSEETPMQLTVGMETRRVSVGDGQHRMKGFRLAQG